MPSSEMTQPGSILVIKLRYHGDVLLTTPVISSLKKNYPNSAVDVLVYSETVPIIQHHPAINSIIGLKKRHESLLEQIKHYLSIIKKLRHKKYDLIINLSDQWSTALLMPLLKAKQSFGQDYPNRQHWLWKHCFDQVVPVAGGHIVESNLSLLKPLKLADIETKTSIFYPQSAWQQLQPQLINQGVHGDYVVIQPTARQVFKCWDDEKFAEVIDYLIGVKGLAVVLTCGPSSSDQQMVQRIAQLSQHQPVLSFAGKTTFSELTALIDHACLFIGVDSAPMHISGALDKPIICLFGATNHHFWRPWNNKYRMVWAGEYQKMPTRDQLNRNYRYLSCIPSQVVINQIESALVEGRVR